MKSYKNEKDIPSIEIKRDDNTVEHLICNDSRRHVISYSKDGQRCSEPNCEINKR